MPSTVDQRPPFELTARLRAIASRHEAVGLAACVVRDGHRADLATHGYADIATRRPIDGDTVFRVASITKTVTAVAVLQLWERGLLELDVPASGYLRSYRLVPASPRHRPATLRHLLTHTAGLGELARPWGALRPDWGESVPAGALLPSLAQLYGGSLRLRAEPGTTFTYGNHSPATLGQIVEDVSGRSLAAYIREHVLDPLGMHDSDMRRSAHVRARLATGYELGRRGPRAVEERDMITTGAASLYSTPTDMARYAAALLGGGSNEHGSILAPSTVAAMFAPQYQPDPRIPGMGLAFFRADAGGHPVVEHQGVHPGFHSLLALAPRDGVGLFMTTNGARKPEFWLRSEGLALLRELIGAPPDQPSTDIPLDEAAWAEVQGWYSLPGSLMDVRKRVMIGAGIEVLERHGRPWLRFLTPVPVLYRGFALHPDDPLDGTRYRLDLDEAGTSRLVFSRGRRGIEAVHMELMPLTLRKRNAVADPRRWLLAALLAAVVSTAAMALRRA